MRFFTLTVILLTSLKFLHCVEDPPNDAYLIASKLILNTQIAEGRDVTMLYGIYNIGMKTAYDIRLTDDTYADMSITVVTGLTSAAWPELPPGSNITHTVILKPPIDNLFYLNFSSAILQYKTSKDAEELIETPTSSPGIVKVMEHAEYSRKFEAHYMDWLALAIMILPTLVIPFLMFRQSNSRYSTHKAKSH